MNNEPNNNDNNLVGGAPELSAINLGTLNQAPMTEQIVPEVPANDNAYIANKGPGLQDLANNSSNLISNEDVVAPIPNVMPPIIEPSVTPIESNVMPPIIEPSAAPIESNVIPDVPVEPNIMPPITEPSIAPIESNVIPDQAPSINIGQAPIVDNAVDNGIMQSFEPAPLTDTLVEPAPQIVLPEQESVGAVPPNKSEKKGMNKVLFIVLIVVLILGVAYGIYYFLAMNLNQANVSIKNLVYNVNETLSTDINYYATFENVETENCSLNTSTVDIATAGIYTYTITCAESSYEATIEIIDNRDFVVEATDLVLFKSEEVEAIDFIVSATKEEITYEIIDQETFDANLVSTGGPYDISILATDNLGNELTITSSYYVIYAFYDVTSEEVDSETFDTTYTITDRFYIDDTTSYMGVSFRTYLYTFDAETYTTVKTEYEDATEFDNLAGTLSFDDENYTVSLEVSLTEETLTIEYGSVFPEDYSSINDYYKNLGYTSNIILK